MFERTTPRFFEHGPSPVSKLLVSVALSVFLMAADSRFQVVTPLREAVAAAIYPLQWLMLQPVLLYRQAGTYFEDLSEVQARANDLQNKNLKLAENASDASFLKIENERLRSLLELRERLTGQSTTAEVIYETPDPYTNRLTINKGSTDGVQEGSIVLDSYGVLGQITRAYPYSSEVRLLSDRQQSVPVMNIRTGLRMVAFGESVTRPSGGLEVRYVPSGTDIQVGDELVTSGIDGYFPAGLPVGTVGFVESHHETPFARIYVDPIAQIQRVRYVIVVSPVAPQGAFGPEQPSAKELEEQEGAKPKSGKPSGLTPLQRRAQR